MAAMKMSRGWMDERGVVVVGHKKSRQEESGGEQMAPKWRLTVCHSQPLFAFFTQHQDSIHFVRISKTHLAPRPFIFLSHTRSPLQPGITSSPYPATHSLVSQRAFCWKAEGYGRAADHPWVNIRHDFASGKNRLFAVLSNNARHAAKASRNILLTLTYDNLLGSE